MTKPIARIGVFHAGLIVLRSFFDGPKEDRRQAWARGRQWIGGVAPGCAKTTAGLLAVSAFILIGLPNAGLLATHAFEVFNSVRTTSHSMPLDAVSSTDLSILSAQRAPYQSKSSDYNFAYLAQVREEALSMNAPVMAVDGLARAVLLSRVEASLAQDRLEDAQRDTKRLQNESLLFFNALREGKSAHQAVELISPPIARVSEERARLERVKRALLAARAVELAKISTLELLKTPILHLASWGLPAPKASHDAWAIAQAQSMIIHGLLGGFYIIAIVFAFGLISFPFSLFYSRLKAKVDERQDELREQLDFQMIKKSAGPAKAPSQSRRL